MTSKMAPKWTQSLDPKRIQLFPNRDSQKSPKWLPNGSPKGGQMELKIVKNSDSRMGFYSKSCKRARSRKRIILNMAGVLLRFEPIAFFSCFFMSSRSLAVARVKLCSALKRVFFQRASFSATFKNCYSRGCFIGKNALRAEKDMCFFRMCVF